ncbi:MAG: SGNH/GDSL hydrolase family protein [Cyanobium sp.]
MSRYRPDPVRGYALRPGAAGVWTREGRGRVSINREGLRDQDHSRQPRPGVLRVAVLGDSFSEALQVDLDQTWWKQLERRLNATPGCSFQEEFPGGVEIVNFGVGGYGTGQELLTWREQARHFGPQKVLLAMFLGNDIQDNTPTARPDGPVFRLGPRESLVMDNSFLHSPATRFRLSPPGQLFDALVNQSVLLQLANEAKNRWAASRRPAAQSASKLPVLAEDAPEGWTVTARLLKTLRDEVRATGAQLVVTSLSTPEQLWPDRQARQRAFAQAGQRPFGREERLRSLLDPLGVPYVPLAQAMQLQADRQGLVLHGFPGPQAGQGHWNPRGHALAADLLAQRLCALGAPR